LQHEDDDKRFSRPLKLAQIRARELFFYDGEKKRMTASLLIFGDGSFVDWDEGVS